MLTDFVDGNNVGMLETGRRLRFGLKSLEGPGGSNGAPNHKLERDDSIQALLPRPKHHAHPTVRDLLEQFIIAQ